LSRLFCQDQGQDFYFRDQDQDSGSQDQDQDFFLSSRRLETKTLVSRTTSLNSAMLMFTVAFTNQHRNMVYYFVS